MTLIELLDEIKRLREKIKHQKEAIEFYDARAKAIPGPIYDEERVDRTPSGKSYFENPILKKLDVEKSMKENIDMLTIVINEASLKLEDLENINHRYVILYRDILGKTFDEVSSLMNLAKSSIYRIHNEALRVIKSISS